MKTLFSLPKDEGFYSRYATLLPTLRKLGYLAQVVSAITEIGVIYAVIYSSLADFWPDIAATAATAGAFVGTAFLEIGLRQFLPYSARAILHRRFAGLDRLMTVFILAAAVGLLLTSATLSFKGSKTMVEAAAPLPRLESSAQSDREAQQFRNNTLATFAQDSAEIANRYKALISSQKTAFYAKIQNAQRRTGSTDKGTAATARAQVASLTADKAAALADLEGQKAQELRQAAERKNKALERTAEAHDAERQRIAQGNATAIQRTDRKVRQYGNGLAWFTVVCMVVLIISVTLEEAFSKGAGIEELPLPNQYHFSQPIGAALANAFWGKWQHAAHSLVKRLNDGTPPAHQPSPPPVLYDLADWKSRRITLKPGPEQMNKGAAAPIVATVPAFEGVKLASLADELLRGNDNLNNATVTGQEGAAKPDPFLKECAQCGAEFTARVQWAKFCCEACKFDFHEQRTGKRFDPKKFHGKK